jgi:hypothetical protein
MEWKMEVAIKRSPGKTTTTAPSSLLQHVFPPHQCVASPDGTSIIHSGRVSTPAWAGEVEALLLVARRAGLG